mmetsp:Transcript_9520/g.23305  ORF Transcript_9520/g.23305 Transcript_9520/m.23305 type:complete len:97 (+) Transcript_9520:950-1240(+)
MDPSPSTRPAPLLTYVCVPMSASQSANVCVCVCVVKVGGRGLCVPFACLRQRIRAHHFINQATHPSIRRPVCLPACLCVCVCDAMPTPVKIHPSIG